MPITTADAEAVLEDVEREALIAALKTGKPTYTKIDLQRVFDWAIDTKINQSLLELALANQLEITFNASNEMAFALSEDGELTVAMLDADGPVL